MGHAETLLKQILTLTQLSTLATLSRKIRGRGSSRNRHHYRDKIPICRTWTSSSHSRNLKFLTRYFWYFRHRYFARQQVNVRFYEPSMGRDGLKWDGEIAELFTRSVKLLSAIPPPFPQKIIITKFPSEKRHQYVFETLTLNTVLEK